MNDFKSFTDLYVHPSEVEVIEFHLALWAGLGL